MRLKAIYILLITLLSTTINVQAHDYHNNQLQGEVKTKDTNEHLSYIAVSLEGTQYHTITNDDGQFQIKNIEPGTYTLNITAVGYNQYREQITFKGKENKTINIELQPSDQQLSEVSVIASSTKLDRQRSAIITSNITNKTFEATQSNTLGQGLNYIPGVRVETTCQNCGSQEVRINGLEGNYSQILVDGQPSVGALTKTYGLDQFPVNMIDRVDVVRGGSSALYSSNAIGGVINILTKEPTQNYYEAKYSLAMIDAKAADNTLSLNTTLVDPEGKSGVSLFANMRHRSPWDANHDGFTEIGKNQTGAFGIRTYIKPTTNNKLAIEYRYISEERRGGDNLNRPPHEANIAEYTNYKIHTGSATYEQYFHNKMQRLKAYATIQDARRDSYFGANKEPNGYGNTSEQTLIANLNYEINSIKALFMPAKFTIGFTQSHDMLKNQMPGYNYQQNQLINLSTLYAQNEWRDDNLALSVGLRAEKHSMIHNINLVPRANIRYQILHNLNLRGTYTEGYRSAELTGADLDISIQDGEATLLQIAKNIKPERSRGFSGGFDYTYYTPNLYTYFLIEAFSTRINHAFIDRIIGESEYGNTILQRENANRATITGINAEATIETNDWLQINAGYTIQKGRYKNAETWSDDQDVPPTKDLLRSPNQYGFITLIGQPPKSPFSTSITGTYTGSMKVPHLAGYIEQDELKKTKTFFDMTIKLNYTFQITKTNQAQISTGIQNIFNQRQKDYDKGINRDSDYIYGPALPRTYFIALKINSL